MTAAQPRVPGRLVTLNPFELGISMRAVIARASPVDVGCVDWYLYPSPVNRKERRSGGSRSAPRGAAAAPSRGILPA
jgi:hypothetical protein